MTSGNSTQKTMRRAVMALVVFCGFAALLFFTDEEQRYLWVKALHIIAVVSWMAGLLYLPRLFINHLGHAPGSEVSEVLKGMERRLMNIIMMPAMVLSWVFGLWLAIEIYGFHGGWLHMKLLAVVLLTGSHFYMMKAVAAFGRDERPGSDRFWRLFNEVPTVLMIVIVILVILKPFA